MFKKKAKKAKKAKKVTRIVRVIKPKKVEKKSFDVFDGKTLVRTFKKIEVAESWAKERNFIVK